MESHLKEKQRNYFCSDDDITIVDVQYYYIIKQITMLDQSRQITESRDYPMLTEWIQRVTQVFNKKAVSQQLKRTILEVMD